MIILKNGPAMKREPARGNQRPLKRKALFPIMILSHALSTRRPFCH